MSRYEKLLRQRKGPVTVAALAAFLAVAVAGMRWTEPTALATSGGNPYEVSLVTDTNPDPTIVETTIVAAGTTEDIGGGVMANLLTFNGTLPGPEFRLNVGDTVIVHYQNNLGHASGIHWHGIELANASDGTPLTQNMVPPGGTFLYKFTVPRPGLYWYHPHHHSSTNQVFKGLYGSIIVTDPNEAALQTSGTLPPQSQTLTMVLSDLTVCKAVGLNDVATYDLALPHVSGGTLPAQFGPTPQTLCELTPIDEDGNPRGPYVAGDVPNIQLPGVAGAVNEGQTVVTNGQNVGARAGTPSAPGALAPGASTHPVNAGQGLRLQLVSSATTRFFRLRLTDQLGTQIPLVRVGGQGGLLDNGRVEGGVDGGGFDFRYDSGEILLDPGDRADVVAAIPATATGVLTLWTEDFQRTGGGFTNTPTVPVAHFEVTGAGPAFTIADGTPLRAATGNPVEVLGAATGTLLDPSGFAPAKPGMSNQDIRLTNVPGTGPLGINGVQGAHDPGEPYSGAPHPGSTRYAQLGDTLELTVTNQTGAHHPFHLHGFSIQPLTLTRPGNPTYVFPYAEFKDNVDVPGNYTLTFRVRLDDRALMDGSTLGGALGRWVFHCHIFFHASFGMISEFDVVAPSGNERPYINSNTTRVTGLTGDLFTMQGTFADPDSNPVTLSASTGAIVDNGGGLWTWAQTAPTSGLVYVTATDSTGLKDQVAFDVVVNSPQSQIAGTKTVSGTFMPGGNITYTVVLTNNGIGTQADNAGNEFTDVLPAALTLDSAVSTSGTAVSTIATNTVTWNGSIPASGSVTITINATIRGTTAGGTTVLNQGTASFDRDNNGSNETSDVTDDPGVAGASNPTSVTVSSPATVTATKTATGTFQPGSTVTYTVVLANSGPAAQFNNPGDEFTDVLPASLTLTSATATSGTAVAAVATRTVTWNGSVAAGGTVTITINATISASTALGTTVSNQGTASFDADGNGASEASALTDDPAVGGAGNPTSFTVSSPATISATKTVTGTFRPDGAITYTVVLTNTGASAQFDNAGHEFSDVLPGSLTLVSAHATSGTSAATIATNTVTWNGSLAAGASATITINATIVAATVLGATVSNQGTASFDADGNGTNEATALTDDPGVAGAANLTSFTVSSPATIAATKTVTGTFRPGGAITYTVVLTNTSASTQFDNPGNELTDVLPASLTLVSASATSGAAVATLATSTVTWNGALAAGDSVTITIAATIPGAAVLGTTVTNQGTVSFDADGNGTNEATAFTDDPGLPGIGNPTSFTVTSPATIAAIKSVTGTFRSGGAITYTVVLTNTGAAAQFDNPGAELTDILPASLTLISTSATSGTAVATIASKTVTWNGSLAAGASVTITIGATINASTAGGTTVANQGTVSFDADGNGTNEASGVTDDPGVAGAANPTLLTVNGPPTISALANATIAVNASHAVTFTIGDDLTAPAALAVSAGSSNPALVPAGGLVLGGAGSTRTLTITPLADQTGQTVISVNVADGAFTTTVSLVLTVATPTNEAPAISGLAPTTIEENTTATVSFDISDDATSASALTVSATSSNTILLPAAAVVLGGSGATRTLSLTPSEDLEGQATISVSVSDGTLSTTVPIVLTVAPAPPPQPPTMLAATVSDTVVSFTWARPAAGAVPTFYVLEGGTAPGLSTLPAINTDGRATAWTSTLPSGTYFFRARSGNSAGTSAVSNEVVVRVDATSGLPGPPLGFVVGVADTQVTLHWRPATIGGAPSMWQLEVGTTPGGSEVESVPLPVTELSVSGALAPGDYFARVRGINAAGQGPASNEARFRVGDVSACDLPDPPVLLPATVSGSSVTLSWRPPRNAAVASYRLLAGSAPGASDLGIFDVGPVTAFVADAGPGIYYVTLLAINSCGTSNPSASLEVVVGDTTRSPAPPSDVHASVDGDRVTIQWSAVAGASSYLVEAGSAPGASDIAVQPVAAPMLVAEGVPSGVYYVRVRAVSAGGASVPSIEVVVTVP